MIWMTWRQFRTQAWVTGGAIALFGVALLITGISISHAYTSLGVATCGSDCSSAVASFLNAARGGLNGTVHDLAGVLVVLLPAVVGVFWGAPLVARELDSGTYRVAWSQSVPRGRWVAVKLGLVGAASAAAAGLLSWAVTQWAHHVDAVDAGRIVPAYFSARGVVPIAYALFAFALGVTLGLVIRRTLPAMAATLVAYGAVLFAMTQWGRKLLLPPVELTRALDVEHLNGIIVDPAANRLVVDANVDDLHGWVQSSKVLTADGTLFSAPVGTTQCGRNTTFEACQQWLTSQHLVQSVLYQPESRFWSLQWIEAGVFVALAGALAAFCVWRVRRIG
ncbi:hypothetical protein [Xylanimonas sp. McL0601]|uniref:hypothetical protein n=1 Tax=Xylanimonas sp. McL0601 TaxID=3414739 RepID=UPI003CEAFBA0